MSVFDSKNFNAEVFGRYLETVPRVKQNALLKAGILRGRPDLKATLAEQTGGSYITAPMTGLIGGAALNYDGSTDITATAMETYLQSMIVVGRAMAWQERDFSQDITGHDFMADIASQVALYWDDVDQLTLMNILAGIFGVSANGFSGDHTLDISLDANPCVGAATLNTAIQKAAGANKDIFNVVILHSVVATNLEILQLLEYMKYSDGEGLQRDMSLATWNGRTVMVDDGVPVEHGYYAATASDAGALKVVASGAGDGEVLLSAVQAADFAPAGVAAGSYVAPGNRYTSYVLGAGAFDYCDCGARVPYEIYRDPTTYGGQEMLITRQRKLFAPRGFSFVQPSPAVTSPSDAQLASAQRWAPVADTAGTGYYDSKAMPFARIISRG